MCTAWPWPHARRLSRLESLPTNICSLASAATLPRRGSLGGGASLAVAGTRAIMAVSWADKWRAFVKLSFSRTIYQQPYNMPSQCAPYTDAIYLVLRSSNTCDRAVLISNHV